MSVDWRTSHPGEGAGSQQEGDHKCSMADGAPGAAGHMEHLEPGIRGPWPLPHALARQQHHLSQPQQGPQHHYIVQLAGVNTHLHTLLDFWLAWMADGINLQDLANLDPEGTLVAHHEQAQELSHLLIILEPSSLVCF